ncbi:hypothetical protein AB0C11_33710 [Streptomyces sp. NPDC039016]|uniref:hypothetical protein n=1 Tax=Streptomyces sp. NPDC039016 TaxID=3154330 RepID=UPI0033D0AB9B
MIQADSLSAILDKVTPHCLDASDLDVVVLDCARGWLYAVAAGQRTIAIARTAIENTAHWVAPLAYDDVSALCVWLESHDHIHVEHSLGDGRPLLHFTEGVAHLTVPVTHEAAVLPWREVLHIEARSTPAVRNAMRVSAEDLALWEQVGADIEVRPAAGAAAFIITGPDFIGVQLPHPQSPAGEPLDGWHASLRTRSFLHKGLPYEVGATYADRQGTLWRVPAWPAPGEEPMVVAADAPAVALPLSVALKTGGHLLRVGHVIHLPSK